MSQKIAVPGQLLGPADKYIARRHPHSRRKFVCLAPRHGRHRATREAPGPAKRLTKIEALQTAATLPTISVSRSGISEKREVLPEVGNFVLCRVTRIQPRQATVAILVVGETVLEAEWQGVIRSQDVRATEKDKVKIYESFRPGDIVRAQVISLGDQANYYLSTASNELGVIMATSEAGNSMFPVSWKEYRDTETGLSESRKVAKPF
ncbi:hypothetical protein G7054_g12343 [Neopestalotiopsis clavispora]|nr:hypothetical protein G7054_g12343 [Neopestalotiopsis clavispora]